MTFHPLTHIFVSIELAAAVLIITPLQGLVLCAAWMLCSLLLSNRTGTRLTPVFIKILIIAAFFLFLIHGVSYREFAVSADGLRAIPESFIHIAFPVAAIIYFSRNIRHRELYALLLDLRIPPSIIFILFRTLWLVPRFVERIDEVMIAQRLRGMHIETTAGRLKALIPTLGPIVSSMLEETSENSLTLTARGFLESGKKSHVAELRYTWWDMLALFPVPVILLFLIL